MTCTHEWHAPGHYDTQTDGARFGFTRIDQTISDMCDQGEDGVPSPTRAALLEANEALDLFAREGVEIVRGRDRRIRELLDQRNDVSAQTITDEMVQRGAKAIMDLMRDGIPLSEKEGGIYDHAARYVLAAALSGTLGKPEVPSDESLSLDSSSVPAVPVDEEAL